MLKEINKILHSTKRQVDELCTEGKKLIENLNESSANIHKKLQALDVLFNPLYSTKRDLESKDKKKKDYNLTSEIIESLSAGLTLFNKIKGGIKEYGKSR